jgi:hypothetical protein
VAAPSLSLDTTSQFPYLLPPDEEGDLGRLAGYRVFGVLGSGGMGTVFAAEDVALRRPVALKVMNPDLAADPVNGWQRFFREARALAAIKHPNLVTVYQVGHEGNAVYLAMEQLEGQTLAARILDGEPPTPEEVVRIGTEVAAALSAIHDRGFIHRDVKPANIWIEANGGRVKLLDFGLVRSVDEDTQLTEAGMVVGTPAFMSPEQMRGRGLDCRTDLFSLGCVLYTFCTRRQPFQGDTPLAMAAALAADEPPPVSELNPAIPATLSDLIMELLAKNAANRPASAKVVIDRLAKALRPRVVDAKVVEETERAARVKTRRVKTKARKKQPFYRRHAVKLVAGLWLVVAGLVMAAVAGDRGNPATKNTDVDAKPQDPPQNPDKGATPPQKAPEVVYLAEAAKLRMSSNLHPTDLPDTDGTVVVGSATYPRGIFMHPMHFGAPAAHITYKLDKGYSRLLAGVAFNDSGERIPPPVVFTVYGDGKQLWTSGQIARGPTRNCDVDVRGVNELRIEVTAVGSPMGAHAVWIDPRLTK